MKKRLLFACLLLEISMPVLSGAGISPDSNLPVPPHPIAPPVAPSAPATAIPTPRKGSSSFIRGLVSKYRAAGTRSPRLPPPSFLQKVMAPPVVTTPPDGSPSLSRRSSRAARIRRQTVLQPAGTTNSRFISSLTLGKTRGTMQSPASVDTSLSRASTPGLPVLAFLKAFNPTQENPITIIAHPLPFLLVTLGSPSGPATGNGNTVLVAPNGNISATGSVLYMTVSLLNAPDGGTNEFLSANWNLNTVAMSSAGFDPSSLSMSFSPYTGPPDPSLFQAVLRTVTYQNNKPNPTPGPRTITVVLSNGATSTSATTVVNVQGSGGGSGPTSTTISAPSVPTGSPALVTVTVTSVSALARKSLGAFASTTGLGGVPTGSILLSVSGDPPFSIGTLNSQGMVSTWLNPSRGPGDYTLYATYIPTGTFLSSSAYGDLLVTTRRPARLLPGPSTYYVSTSKGDDSYDGSESRPWKTIAHVNDAIAGSIPGGPTIQAGDTIRFRRDEQFPGSIMFPGVGGAPGQLITLRDYDDRPTPSPNPPRIYPQAGPDYPGLGYGIKVLDAGYFEIFNLEIIGDYLWASDTEPGPAPVPFNPPNRLGIWFVNTGANGTQTSISIHDMNIHHFAVDRDFMYDSGRGIFFDAGDNTINSHGGYTGITVYNCELHHNGVGGIELAGVPTPNAMADSDFTNVTIQYVNAHHNSAPSNARPENVTNPMASAVIPGGDGVHLYGVNNGLVQYCQASYNGNAQIRDANNNLVPDTGVAFSAYYSNHLLFQHNEAHHQQTVAGGDEGGFDFDIFTMNSIMQFNYSHDNDGWGFMLGATLSGASGKLTQMNENNIIRFNISWNDCRNTGSGSLYGALLFEDWPASCVYVYNNTFFMSKNSNGAPSVLDFNAYSNAGAMPVNYVYNNLLLSDPETPSVVVQQRPDANYLFRGNGLHFQANDYYPSAPPAVVSDPMTVSVDPQLGFETNPMATNPALLFSLSDMTPKSIREGGVDLATIIGTNWWAPDAYWQNTFSNLPAQDFFGTHFATPTRPGGVYCRGAAQPMK